MAHQHHDHGDHHHGGHDHGDLADLLDLDAEITRDQTDELTAWIATATGEVTRILDLGAGTGAGTFALLRRFPGATVTAVDTDPDMLHRLKARAGEAGHVHTVQADLDAGWPDLEPVDLVWASASMHHMADPSRVLRDVAATLRRPGGTLALVEIDTFPRFLPDGAAGGVEERLQAAADAARAAELPYMGADWAAVLGRTGFTVLDEREFTLSLAAPVPDVARRYAHASLSRMRDRAADTLDAGQRAALDDLLDGDGPDSLRRRDDLTVRTTRRAWLARPA
jgi:SAM-dependent methyltransferase